MHRPALRMSSLLASFGLSLAILTATPFATSAAASDDADAATSPNAGLQKWVRDDSGVWRRVYVLQSGLGLGRPYSVSGYPVALNPSPDGLRNITGRVGEDDKVEIWAVTSTVSANGDQGADPNQLVYITDKLDNADASFAATERFQLLRTASYGEVLRGVSFTPGSCAPRRHELRL